MGMAFHKSLCCCFLAIFVCSSHAYTFEVGGKHGWTTHPFETYNTWAARLRFLINDTLHFKYDGKLDSVLVVNKPDYDACNVNTPIMKLDSMFKFDRSGPFYFISGNKPNCDQGQKLIVVVLALRNKSSSPPANLPPTISPSPTPGGEGASSPASSRGSASSPTPGGGGASSPKYASSPAAAGRGNASPPPQNAPDEGGGGRGGVGPESPGGNNNVADVNTSSTKIFPTKIESLLIMVITLWWSIQ